MNKKDVYDLAEKIMISALAGAVGLDQASDDELKTLLRGGMDEMIRVSKIVLEYKEEYLRDQKILVSE